MLSQQDMKTIQSDLISLESRAEKVALEKLEETFVDAEPLFTILKSRNNQIIYGRRGTGKTHALKFLSQQMQNKNHAVNFIDLRSVGSNGSIYSDNNKPFGERATLLLTDVLAEIHDHVLSLALENIELLPNPMEITKRLDVFEESISQVRVTGTVTATTEKTNVLQSNDTKSGSLEISETPSAQYAATRGVKNEESLLSKTSLEGVEKHHIHFGDVQNSLKELLLAISVENYWLLLDEWSEIPIDLQPYLADFLRRTLFPIPAFNVKIAAIEHRTNFRLSFSRGEYIGLELGADVSADLNLDDFMVFDNDSEKSVEFFKNLLFRHFSVVSSLSEKVKSADQLVQILFTQSSVFEEFVRASEGVPRDAIHLISQIVRVAFGKKVSVENVRTGARTWYTRDKSMALKSSQVLSDVMEHIIQSVIGKRKARAFLFRSDRKNDIIEQLFDSRLVHILKKNISDKDNPGVRYDVYKLDYGCYVDLINTTQAPLGLFVDDDECTLEVPPDDYRSIRRAILDESQLARITTA